MTDETPLQKAEREKLEAETAKLGSEGGKVSAETKKAGAEADKATRDAAIPAPPTIAGGVEGKTTDEDKDGMLGRMVAYRLLGDAAAEIANAIPDPVDPGHKSRVLLVEDRSLIESDWPYRVVSTQLGSEKTAVEAALGRVKGLPAPAAAPVPGATGVNKTTIAPLVAVAAGAAVLSTATSLIGLFRTDYTISGGEAKIGVTPLLAATAKALHAKGCKVVVDGFELLEGDLVESFWGARESRLELEAEIAAKRTQYGAAELPSGTPVAVGTEAGRATLAAAEVTIKAFDDFTKAMTTAAGQGSPPLLVSAARRERLHLPATDRRAVSHVVYAAVEGGGQEAIAKHGGFGSNKRASFLGGAQVSYLLHDVAQNATIAAGSRQLVGQIEFDLSETRAKPLERIAIEPSGEG